MTETKPAGLKIRIYRPNDDKPKTTISIPPAAIRLAARLIPTRLVQDLNINVDEIVQAIQSGHRGLLMTVEEEDRRIEISLE